MVIFTLALSMAVTLFLVNRKLNIGYSLIVGALLLAILNGRSISYIVNLFFKSLIEDTTVSLVFTIGLITILGHLMEKYLILDRMIYALENMLRSAKGTILAAPAIIGTLLVTGGALMSCPVVDNLGERLNIPRDKRAAINLIFRHALYFIFPLSPAIVLAAQLGEFNVWDFIKLQFPIALMMYIVGYIVFLRGYREPKLEKASPKQYFMIVIRFLKFSSPILISVFGAALLNLPFYISLVPGIILCFVINLFDKRNDHKYDVGESVFMTIYNGIKPSMIISIIGIMVFKNFVNDIQEIQTSLSKLLEIGIPLEILILLAGAIISFPLASTQPGIAILFPIILPLASSYEIKLLYAMFIYTSAFIFYFISPLHLCQVLTIEHFSIHIKELYRHYVIILPLIFLTMLVIYMIN